MKDTQRKNIAVSLLRLLEPGDVVYLRKPDLESNQELAEGLSSLINELGSDGPFSVIKSTETPDSIPGVQRILGEYIKNIRDSIQVGYTALFKTLEETQ